MKWLWTENREARQARLRQELRTRVLCVVACGDVWASGTLTDLSAEMRRLLYVPFIWAEDGYWDQMSDMILYNRILSMRDAAHRREVEAECVKLGIHKRGRK